MDIKENFQIKLNELRGKSSLSDDERKKLKDRIHKKHGKAWNDTIDIRKEKKSAGPADTKDMDKLRNRLAKMYNNLEEEQLDELKGHRDPEGQELLQKLGIRASKRMRSKNPKTVDRNERVMNWAYKNKKNKAGDW